MVEIEEQVETQEEPKVSQMKLEDILNDLYKKMDIMQQTIGYILEKTNLIPENK